MKQAKTQKRKKLELLAELKSQSLMERYSAVRNETIGDVLGASSKRDRKTYPTILLNCDYKVCSIYILSLMIIIVQKNQSINSLVGERLIVIWLIGRLIGDRLINRFHQSGKTLIGIGSADY